MLEVFVSKSCLFEKAKLIKHMLNSLSGTGHLVFNKKKIRLYDYSRALVDLRGFLSATQVTMLLENRP